VKESPQEIGFTIGAIVGFLWLVYAKVGRGPRNGGSAIYIFMMICAGIGWLIGSLISWLIGG
jgi:hypothetical protein